MTARKFPPRLRPTTEADIEKMRADLARWQAERHKAAKAYRRRRNDSGWRTDCLIEYGDKCVACGVTGVQMDHIIPRSQGGVSVVENGLPLCGPYSSTIAGGHHAAKTNGRLKIRYEWLTERQRQYLAESGWVDWDDAGLPFGVGYRHFGNRPEMTTRPPDLERPAGGV